MPIDPDRSISEHPGLPGTLLSLLPRPPPGPIFLAGGLRSHTACALGVARRQAYLRTLCSLRLQSGASGFFLRESMNF